MGRLSRSCVVLYSDILELLRPKSRTTSVYSAWAMPSNKNSVLLLNLALILVLVNRAYVSYQVKQFIRELTKLGYISQKRAIQLNQ